MPKSRLRVRHLKCPSCHLRCWLGLKRLLRHARKEHSKIRDHTADWSGKLQHREWTIRFLPAKGV